MKTLPMLAHNYAQHPEHAHFPCDMQPKFDGFRALYNSQDGMWSRNGNTIGTFSLTVDTKGKTLDGELKLPEGYTFQQTCRAIKKANGDTPKLIYYVFDVVAPDLTWEQRKALLADLSNQFPKNVVMVPTVELTDRADVDRALQFLVEAGHEGLIIRNKRAHYEVDRRSYDLLKYKPFEDAEFTVSDVLEGEGKDKGCAVLELSNPDGKTAKAKKFTARPVGTYASRAELFRNRAKVIGQCWTIRFMGKSEDLVPRHPRAIAEREAWDK